MAIKINYSATDHYSLYIKIIALIKKRNALKRVAESIDDIARLNELNEYIHKLKQRYFMLKS